MQLNEIPLPEVYRESADFRFFVDWFSTALTKIQYDTTNVTDLYDPERCPADLLWLLCETYGYTYDGRLSVAFNRLVLLYFMSMIYNRGSRNGMMLAAELNLAQFSLNSYAEEDDVYNNRLKDTSIPVNSVYVTSHTAEGYIDVVYYSENEPVDACIEYVRPLGMYCFKHAGVRVDARTKISVDARLTDINNIGMSIGPTRVGHYRRDDYASLQNGNTPRHEVYKRNIDYEKDPSVNAGYRSLYSLQLSNNDHIVKSLIPDGATSLDGNTPDPFFSLGYGPQDVEVTYPDNYLKNKDLPMFNLRYDLAQEEAFGADIYTIDKDRTSSVVSPRPAINPVMSTIGDAIALNDTNTKYTAIEINTAPTEVTPTSAMKGHIVVDDIE